MKDASFVISDATIEELERRAAWLTRQAESRRESSRGRRHARRLLDRINEELRRRKETS